MGSSPFYPMLNWLTNVQVRRVFWTLRGQKKRGITNLSKNNLYNKFVTQYKDKAQQIQNISRYKCKQKQATHLQFVHYLQGEECGIFPE